MRAEISEHLEERDVGHAVKSALQRLLDHDSFLFVIDANERSITHRLAMYLQDEFGEWNVDCEYNRDDHDPKELYLGDLDPDNRDTDAKTVFPDIIVHARGKRENLLVVEVKKTTSRIGSAKDFEKLTEYLRQLDYRHGLFIEFQTGEPEAAVSQVRWF